MKIRELIEILTDMDPEATVGGAIGSWTLQDRRVWVEHLLGIDLCEGTTDGPAGPHADTRIFCVHPAFESRSRPIHSEFASWKHLMDEAQNHEVAP